MSIVIMQVRVMPYVQLIPLSIEVNTSKNFSTTVAAQAKVSEWPTLNERLELFTHFNGIPLIFLTCGRKNLNWCKKLFLFPIFYYAEYPQSFSS